MAIQIAGGTVVVGAHQVAQATPASIPEGDHAYFETLIARADHWLSYSLRDNAQLATYSVGSAPKIQYVTYNPGSDTDPQAQDAAKVLMPWFIDAGLAQNTATNVLTQGVETGDTTIYVSALNDSVFVNGRSILIDSEIMTLTAGADEVGGTLEVERGAFGTTVATHAVGTLVMRGSDGLQNQVRLPLNTTDGHTYLFTWDVYPTSSMVGTGLTNHKTFQFATGGQGDKIWSEHNFRYSGSAMSPVGFNQATDVATVEMRSYNSIPGVAVWEGTRANGTTPTGDTVTALQPVTPWTSGFIIKPNVWMRWWVRVEQNAADFTYMDVWCADETQAPVQVYTRVPLNIPTNATHTIGKFWIEFNTSNYEYTKGDPDPLSDPMTVYVRNFVALIDPPSDVSSLLVQP